LDTLEEAVILGASCGSLLVRVMLQDLLSVSTLDLFLGRLVAVLG